MSHGLVMITLGGNDFVNNYYLVPLSLRSRQFSLPDFVRYLILEYRKVLVVGFLSMDVAISSSCSNSVKFSVPNFCRGCTSWGLV